MCFPAFPGLRIKGLVKGKRERTMPMSSTSFLPVMLEDDTLELGWKLLHTIPRAELKRIRPEYLEKYYPEKK
jgi:vacuolar-type H+-ATPase subunit B/Vma2